MLKIQTTTSKPFSVTFKDGLLDEIKLKVHYNDLIDMHKLTKSAFEDGTRYGLYETRYRLVHNG